MLEAHPLCDDLHGTTFQEPQSCTLNGQLGTKLCTQTCTLYRDLVFRVSGTTCEVTSTDCTPWSFGPSEVIGEQGPL